MAVTQEERDYVRLVHIRDEAHHALIFSEGQTRASLNDDTLQLRALQFCVEIIGRNAAGMSPAFQEANPQIDWSRFIELSKHLLEQYNAVDLDWLWETIHVSIPSLIVELEKLLPPENDNQP